MKNWLTFFLLLTVPVMAWGQGEIEDDDWVDLPPMIKAKYPGGMDAFEAFIDRKVKYPPSCYEHGVEGNVSTRFVVDKSGSVVDIKVISSSHELFSKEMVRVLHTFPKWKPAKQREHPVRSLFQIDMSFANRRVRMVRVGTVIHAMYEGGRGEIYKYFEENLPSGQSFSETMPIVVDENGRASLVNVSEVKNTDLRAVLTELIKNMPGWICATVAGEPVKDYLQLVIKSFDGKVEVEIDYI